MSYQERTVNVVHGLPFEATRKQAREVRIRLAQEPAWLEWARLDTLARMTHLHVDADLAAYELHRRNAGDLAVRLAAADRDMTAALGRIIDQVCADDD